MGLIRIAFGRSLSSYLTFLQGTVVSLQESCRDKQIHLLELHHKTHDLGEILSRLAHLCQCVGVPMLKSHSRRLLSSLFNATNVIFGGLT